jgi:hypothetical protein
MIRKADPTLDGRTRPTGTFVTIRSRDDLNPSSDEVAIQHSGRSVTAVPENVGLCQVVDVGPDVTNVRPGDVAFIDFFDVAQGYLLAGEEIYVTPASSLRMRLDIETAPVISQVTGQPVLHQKTKQPLQNVVRCDIHPLPGYVLTKHAPDRMTVVITGHDRQILPRHMTTSGIVGGRTEDGDPTTFVVYEEVVKVGSGDIQCEREDGYTERKLKARIQRLEAELAGSGFERPAPAPDVAPGDLVVFCTQFAIQFRALGEQFRCVPYKNLLAVVDDRAILAAYNATNPPPPLVQIIGGGAKLLYGTG